MPARGDRGRRGMTKEQAPVPAGGRALADWNDAMYAKHPTPYGGGIAGAISAARVRTVLRLAKIRPEDAVLELGCESGHLLLQVPACRLRVGADISQAALDDAAAAAKRMGAE